ESSSGRRLPCRVLFEFSTSDQWSSGIIGYFPKPVLTLSFPSWPGVHGAPVPRLKSRDGKPLSEFEVTGADSKFVAAEAAIDGDTVVVQAKEVESPAQVRFGWSNTANPNLINKEGLPASPFQSNCWQGGTGE
ncbi:MAG: hypothetical protein WCJ35_26195, partial [Planctomycetota bacterium]